MLSCCMARYSRPQNVPARLGAAQCSMFGDIAVIPAVNNPLTSDSYQYQQNPQPGDLSTGMSAWSSVANTKKRSNEASLEKKRRRDVARKRVKKREEGEKVERE